MELMKLQQQLPLPQNPLPIVIIGAGGIVNDGHLPAYTLGGFQILGLYDLDIQKAESLRKKFSIIEKVYGSLGELITDASTNNAIYDIAVPASHIMAILEQLPDGVPVLIQKPMGETLQEAKLIRDLCETKKLISAVNFQLRFAPYILAAKDMIAQGLLGQVFDIELKVCVHTPWELWDFLKGLPRLEILYHSIHYLDLVRSFWGNPIKVYASTVKHPKTPHLAATRSAMILDYSNDRQARILTNHGHDFGLEHQESYLKIEGTQGAIKIKIGLSLDYPKGMPPKMEYVLPATQTGWQSVPLLGGWFPHAFLGSMASLQNHCTSGADLPTNTRDAYQTMQLVEAAYLSNEQGGIYFNEVNP